MYGVVAIISAFVAAGSLEVNEPSGWLQAGIAGIVGGWAAYKQIIEMREMGFFIDNCEELNQKR